MVAALAAPAAPRGARAQETPAATTAPAGPLEAQQYLNQLEGTLLRSPSAQERNEAAQRLAEIDLPAARNILTSALAGGDREAQLACARAIADQSLPPDPRWVQPLIILLRDRQAESVARALSRYDENPAAMQALIDLARSRAAANVRAPAIRAMGRMVQKSVAESLITLLSDPAQEPSTRAAAADALADLSGQSGNDQDAAKWARWWNQRRGIAPAQWRAQVIAEQHPLLQGNAERMREQLRAFKQSARDYLELHYQRQPADSRPAVLLAYLNDPNPDIRAAGAWIVTQAVNLGQPIRADTQRRLIELVGDASVDVRLETVRALARLPNPAAPDAILTQLRVEPNPDMKIEMCDALRAMSSEQAIPEVLRLLRDPSVRVATAAANALRGLAPIIQKKPNLATRVIQELRQTMDQRTAPPGPGIADPASDELRSATVAALAPLVTLAEPREMFNRLSGLLNLDESPRTRAAALEALGGLGPVAAETIAQELLANYEPDPLVRAEAAKALGQTGSYAHAHFLDDSAREENETNPEVRRQARAAFQGLLPGMPPRDLTDWAQVFNRRKDITDEIGVLKALCEKLAQQKNFADLAVQQQTLGALYMQMKPPNAPEAIPYLKQALEYYQAHNGGTQVPTLVKQLMEAYLASKRYDEAARFAEQEIALDPANQQTVGPAIRNAADMLVGQGDAVDADRLIRAALNMKEHPLDPIYRDRLDELREKIPGTPTSAPQG